MEHFINWGITSLGPSPTPTFRVNVSLFLSIRTQFYMLLYHD